MKKTDYDQLVKNYGKNFCPLPFTEIANTAQGMTKLCCYSDGLTDDITKEYGSLLQGWVHDKKLNEARQMMLKDQHQPLCKRCTDYENRGAYTMSKRVNAIKSFAKNDPKLMSEIRRRGAKRIVSLDIKFGNKCNLACIMCNSHSSSLHLKEEIKNPHPENVKEFMESTGSFTDFREQHIEEMLTFASSLRRIKMTGGEPLLLPGAIKFLDALSKTSYAKNITIVLVTNGTSDITKLVDMMARFKIFEVHASVDGLGTTFDYIRWPAKWSKISHNYETFIKAYKQKRYKNIRTELNPAVQFLNLAQLPDILQYGADIGFTMWHPILVNKPLPLHWGLVPEKIRLEVLEKLEDISSLPYVRLSPAFEGIKNILKSDVNLKGVSIKNTMHLINYYDKARKYSAKDMCYRFEDLINV